MSLVIKESRMSFAIYNYVLYQLTQLRNLFNSCYETSENITSEIKRDFVSRTFLREESKHLENLKKSIRDIQSLENVYKFFENTQDLLVFLEKCTDQLKTRDRVNKEERVTVNTSTTATTKGRTLQDKMQVLTNMISQCAEELSQSINVPGKYLHIYV